MKTKLIETKQEKQFKPFAIEVTFESEEEVMELWHRINISTDSFNKTEYAIDNRIAIGDNALSLWSLIDNNTSRVE